jgi:hypothetical protein
MAPATAHFSETYGEARSKFLKAVETGGARLLASHRNPARGPDNEDLFTDLAWIGPADARRVLILCSGTHGIEGYSGSGCHGGYLADGLFRHQAGPSTAILFIHAVNPHGFAWARRVNEDNVDLNRNFVDHGKPHPANPDYEAIAEHIDPVAPPDAWAPHNAAIARFLNKDRHDVMCKAMHGGQYVNPRGIFYGGTGPTWSNRTFRAAVGEHAAKAEHICIIDYHTGGGAWGFLDHFVDDDQAGGPTHRWFSHCTVISEDKAAHGKDAQSETPGNMFYAVPEILPGKRYTLGLVELRTGEAQTGIDAIRAENWLYQHGDPASPLGRRIRAQVRERFYPARPEWRIMSYRQSNQLIAEALAGLSSVG